jgi:carbonic anhydrase
MSHGPSISPQAALEKLKEGHQRFREEQFKHNDHISSARREELTAGQAPYASILTCADSRTPPEHLFDAGLGDLFVARNAGNLFEPVTLGSFEYAAAHAGCPLGIVLGHTKCGAVGATLQLVKDPDASESPNVDAITRSLLPAVLATVNHGQNDAEWTDAAARKNVENMVLQAKRQSPLLSYKIKKGEYLLIGGFYDLESGEIEFFE